MRTSIRILLANMAWFVSCLPGWLVFVRASYGVKRAQKRLLLRILRRNVATVKGRQYDFHSIQSSADFSTIPLSEYEDYSQLISRTKKGETDCLCETPVVTFMPTSGSASGTKWIPYNCALKKEFQAGVDPWIASLYVAFPSLLAGRHYWCISPSTSCIDEAGNAVPNGFSDDAEYLGVMQRCVARMLFVVPAEVAQISNQHAFEYVTTLFLVREWNLRLISVWHPSFLVVLLKRVAQLVPSLISDIEAGFMNADLVMEDRIRDILNARMKHDPQRARDLSRIDVSQPGYALDIWPCMQVISCWTDGQSEPWLTDLAVHFPGVAIQSKGLLATEGIVSFPLGTKKKGVCACCSHYYEFIDTENGEVKNAWEVEKGRSYSVVLTTSGGFYRYRLHDVVCVTGFYNQVPCLDFVSRDNLVSDIVGEKLNARHVDDCIRAVEHQLATSFSFAMLAPVCDGQMPRYVLYVQCVNCEITDWMIASSMERQLEENYHYRHAVRIAQLEPLSVFRIEGDACAAYRAVQMQNGTKAGNVKFQSLSKNANWHGIFQGKSEDQEDSIHDNA